MTADRSARYVEDATVDACATLRILHRHVERLECLHVHTPPIANRLTEARKLLAIAEQSAHMASGHIETVRHMLEET